MIDPTELSRCAFAVGDTTPIGSDGSTNSTRLHPDDLSAIISAVHGVVRVQSPWLSADEAAEYLRAPISRIRKLTMTGELPHEKDGRRVLYHKDDLDAFILDGGAVSP
ncbi:MAG: helix-turn-helix domain-containing protein [Ktedonobacterales bacterium]